MKFIHLFLVGTCCAMLWSSCQKNVEGCTNPIASNYNAEADTDCCCEYYQLQISARHWGSDTATAIAWGTTLADASNDSFVPLRAAFLISNIRLVNTQGIEFGVEDSLSATLQNGTSITIEDNFATLASSSFIYELGKFSHLDTFDRLRFTVGLVAPATQIQPSSISESRHPLSSTASVSMYDTLAQQFDAQQLAVTFPNTTDTVTYKLTDTIQIDLAYSVRAIDGADTNIRLDILYWKLFAGINFRTDSNATIRTKLLQNTRQVFAIRY